MLKLQIKNLRTEILTSEAGKKSKRNSFILEATDFERSSEGNPKKSKSFLLKREHLCIEEISNDQALPAIPDFGELEVPKGSPKEELSEAINEEDKQQQFFTMCLLSFKMNNQDLDELLELDHKAMYEKCVNHQEKQFYEFQNWISKEVSKIRFKKVYAKNK